MKFYFEFSGRALRTMGFSYAGKPAALAAAAAAAMAGAKDLIAAAFKMLMDSGKQISETRASFFSCLSFSSFQRPRESGDQTAGICMPISRDDRL